MGRTKIPGPIWYRCNRELDMYELHIKELADLRAEIMDSYEGRNQTLGRGEWDNRYRQMTDTIIEHPATGGGGSIHHTKLDTAIAKLTGLEITELEHDIQRIEDVYKHLTPRQQHFFDLHYRQHLTIVECAKRMSYGRSRVHVIKAEVIEKTAVRLGYIR